MPQSIDHDTLSLIAAIRWALHLAEAQGQTLVAAKLSDTLDSAACLLADNG